MLGESVHYVHSRLRNPVIYGRWIIQSLFFSARARPGVGAWGLSLCCCCTCTSVVARKDVIVLQVQLEVPPTCVPIGTCITLSMSVLGHTLTYPGANEAFRRSKRRSGSQLDKQKHLQKRITALRVLETAEALHPVRSCNHIVTPHIPLRTSHRTSTPTQALLIITLYVSHRNPAAPLDSAPCRPRRLFFAPSGFYSRACLWDVCVSRLCLGCRLPPVSRRVR